MEKLQNLAPSGIAAAVTGMHTGDVNSAALSLIATALAQFILKALSGKWGS